MPKISSTAMVLAAGLGTRMRPLTLAKPKPLQLIGGRTMLDLALDKLVQSGIKRAVVNTFYLAEQIEDHLKSRTDIEITISRETELLDTGGGIANVLNEFRNLPFFALNADLPWFDNRSPALEVMRAKWNPEIMDSLLLAMRTHKALGFSGKGDYMMDADGHLWQKNFPSPRPFVMMAAQIIKPELFLNRPKVFSNKILWDEAEARKRLYGVEHDGTCYHVGTPEDWHAANNLLETGKGWAV